MGKFSDELTKDADRLQDIIIETADRDDIIAFRYIYWLAKSLFDVIDYIRRKEL